MARWWKERYDPALHRNNMWDVSHDGHQHHVDGSAKSSNITQHVVMVQVEQFTFEFLSLGQLKDCIQYLAAEHHASSRIQEGIGAADHWEVQRWYERLPRYLFSATRRPRVLKALRAALGQFSNDPEYNPAV